MDAGKEVSTVVVGFEWVVVLSFLFYFVAIPLVAYLVIRLAIRHELIALKRREQREKGSGPEG
jgi:hypothetical protein